jgi:xylose isomerase
VNELQPKPEHNFTFGLWTVGNRGRGRSERHAFRPGSAVWFGVDQEPVLSREAAGRFWLRRAAARQFDQDQEVQNLLAEIKGAGINTDVRLNADLTTEGSKKSPGLGPYNRATFDSIKNLSLDRTELTNRRLPYERLDQLTIDILLGVR